MDLRELIEDRQIDMFGEVPPPPPDLVPSEDEMRATLTERLEFIASVQEMPWKPERVRHHRTVFAQMCNWLPDDEATRMREAFDGHVERLAAERSRRL